MGYWGLQPPPGETFYLAVLMAAPIPITILAPEGQPSDPSERRVPLAMFYLQGSGVAMIHFSHH